MMTGTAVITNPPSPAPSPAPDRELVYLNEVQEVDYWRKVLGATPEQLRDAVGAVGRSPEKVREYLKK